MPYSPIGLSKWDLDTPALLLDLDRLENNIKRMAERCRSTGLHWRPHTKGHKTPAIAHKKIAAGAIGITCAKLSEAEVMAAAGIRDILIANQIVGAQKVARLTNLQKQADVMVAVDDPFHIQSISEAAEALGVTVRVLVEVNVDMDRCGVAPGEPALKLARFAEDAPGVLFAGIMGYEGHAMAMPDPEKETACRASVQHLVETRELLEHNDLEVGIISAGGTGTLSFTPDLSGITEIQAGGGVMMDTYYRDNLHVSGFETALTILTTVISRPTADRAVGDAGRKTTSNQISLPEVTGRNGIAVKGLSAEHVIFELQNPQDTLAIGDRLELISGYSDMTVFLHDQIYGIRSDRVEAVWDILGRGKLH